MKSFGYIYKITGLDGKIYIGYTITSINNRIKRHLNLVREGSTTHLHNAIRKYGIENFIIHQLDTLYTKEDLINAEINWIKEFDSYNSGYNMTPGGDGNVNPSSETRQKMSQAQIGIKRKPFSIECRRKMSKDRKGSIPWNKGLTKENDSRIDYKRPTKFKEGHKESVETWKKRCKSLSGKNNPNYGKPMSDEQKKKISVTKKTNPIIASAETRKKLSISITKYWQRYHEMKGEIQ